MKTLGEAIRSKRKEMKLAQSGLAAKMGTTQKSVSDWERDEYPPSSKYLILLASVLKCKLDDLAG